MFMHMLCVLYDDYIMVYDISITVTVTFISIGSYILTSYRLFSTLELFYFVDRLNVRNIVNMISNDTNFK